jgi:kynureninase
MDALKKNLISQFLAVKTPNRIWMSHSLPADRYVDDFDTEVFQKQIQPSDLDRLQPVYLLTWGRRHSNDAIEKLSQMLDVDVFILGHQPQETGFAHSQKNLIILASDHNHGCLIRFDLAKSYSAVDLVACIVPVASIA